jgi:hypothetical protein
MVGASVTCFILIKMTGSLSKGSSAGWYIQWRPGVAGYSIITEEFLIWGVL